MTFAIGEQARVKTGASAWMRANRFWLAEWPATIDGMTGTIIHDYTRFAGDDSHYEVSLADVYGCGIPPQFLDRISGPGESELARLAKAPDRDKLASFASVVMALEAPRMTTKAGDIARLEIMDKLSAFGSWIIKQADAI